MARPKTWQSPKELQDKIKEYFTHCKETEKVPNKAGLAVFLDVHRDTLHSYEIGEKDTDEMEEGKKFSDTIKRAYSIIEEAWTQKLSGNNATGPIFYLKAAFKYRDRVDVTSNEKELPTPIMNVQSDDSNTEDKEPE